MTAISINDYCRIAQAQNGQQVKVWSYCTRSVLVVLKASTYLLDMHIGFVALYVDVKCVLAAAGAALLGAVNFEGHACSHLGPAHSTGLLFHECNHACSEKL